ncbi:MAG: OmpA family protein [Prolixibacteraceae bacterium]|nr:OmpA family protein [Prolixibacteraceae bacterium]
MRLKPNLSFFLFFILSFQLFAAKYPHEYVNIPGIENPVDIAISPDGLQMLIIDWPKKEKMTLKISKRLSTTQKWTKAEKIKPINNLIKENTKIEGPFFSFDGNKLYFSADIKGTLGGMDIFYCNIDDGKWSPPVNQGKPVNSNANENHPSVTGNNRNLYFTREVEMDKLDDYKTGELWLSAKNLEDKWSKPNKLNVEINNGGLAYTTAYDDNHTLIYSRIDRDDENWRVYWAKKMNDIHWHLPVKLDILISKDSEIAPFYCKKDGFLYYIVLKDKKHPRGEIFRYQLDKHFQPDKTVEIKGRILDKNLDTPLKANILVNDPIMGNIHYSTQSDEETGEWWTLVKANENYMYHISANNYSHIYDLYTKNKTSTNTKTDYKLFSKATITLNIYDSEELWPVDGKIEIYGNNKKAQQIEINSTHKGRHKITLPLGIDYLFRVNAKHYHSNELKLNLSEIVLFDDFIHDIELEPEKRDLEIYIADKETHNPLGAEITIIDKRGEKFIPEPVKGNVGLYSITLREGEKYDIEVRGPKGFAFKHIVTDLDKEKDLYRKSILLSPLTVKVPIVLNNINFEFNSSDLMESSFPELNRVIQLLTDNPDIHVEIMAHTDDVGSERYNNVLANKRAKSVVKHLIVNGIDPERLNPVGYGESRPLVPNINDENRALNRRVEMQILDEQNETFMIEKRIDNQ